LPPENCVSRLKNPAKLLQINTGLNLVNDLLFVSGKR